MAELLLRISNRLVISKRKKCVRGGLLSFTSHFLLASAFLFAIEIILIALGVGNIFLPLTQDAVSLLSRLFF